MLVLAAAFTIIYARANTRFFSDDIVFNSLMWFLTSLVIVSVCFLLHELGHKYVAQRMGAWAEYRMFPQGLLLALLMSLFGFLFAAPGAVVIAGYVDEKRNGQISMAGPLVNLVLGAVFIVLLYFTTGRLNSIIYLLAHFNVFLALFNLLPIPPLDGSKIYKWSMPVYIAMIVSAAAMLLMFYI